MRSTRQINHQPEPLDRTTDEEIMRRVAEGDLDQLKELFERSQNWIYNFFFQMSPDPALCDDLTQNVFVKVIRYRGSYQGGKFSSWIFTIARNMFADHYRKRQKTAEHVEVESMADLTDDHSHNESDEVVHLRKVIQQLPLADRELIVMSKYQGMKYQEIAEQIGSNENAVKTRIHRIVKRMRTLYFETA